MSVMARRRARLRQALSRCGILLVLMVGHLSAGLFLANLDQGFSDIQDPSIRQAAGFAHLIFETLVLKQLGVRVALLVVILVVMIRQIRGHAMGWFVDLFGGLLLLRCTAQFLVLNLLLLAPMRAGALLLIQLVLFIPVITIAFGWLYWRLDSGARRHGRTHIRFNDSEHIVDRFDYFYVAGITLLSFEPSGATADTRLMKTLFLVHGIVMLDLVALTLSRAIALAGGGG